MASEMMMLCTMRKPINMSMTSPPSTIPAFSVSRRRRIIDYAGERMSQPNICDATA